MVEAFGDGEMLGALSAVTGGGRASFRIEAAVPLEPHHVMLTITVSTDPHRYRLRLPLPSAREPQPWLYAMPSDAADAVEMLLAFLEEEFSTGATSWASCSEHAGVVALTLAPYGLRRADVREDAGLRAVAGPFGWHGGVWGGLDEFHVVRFGADFGADSPLWTIFGLIDADGLQLSPDLRLWLRAWSAEFEQHMDHDYRWSPGFDVASFERRGDELASLVSAELGSDYAVERTTGPALRVIRSDAPPTRPQAAAQLAAWIAEDREAAEPPPHGAVAANIALQFPPHPDSTA